jgi:hypothetical protein
MWDYLGSFYGLHSGTLDLAKIAYMVLFLLIVQKKLIFCILINCEDSPYNNTIKKIMLFKEERLFSYVPEQHYKSYKVVYTIR